MSHTENNTSDKMSNQIDVINVRLSPELIKIIDSLIDKGLYSSRSEFIRDVCRNYALEERYKDE
jgi:Arc/MetJ-type ribon-helix-helix transcriptional regulator